MASTEETSATQPKTWSLGNVLSAFNQWRMSLPNPGPFEQLHKDVRGVFVTNFLFDGAKFDLGKSLSENFQVSHSFSLGSQLQPPAYTFSAIYADKKTFLNGSMDHEGTLMGRANYSLTPSWTAKFQTQLSAKNAAQSMVQWEADYGAMDQTLNVKAINPSPLDQTGIFVVSGLRSLTQNLAVGVECAVQRPTADMHETQLSYVARLGCKDAVLTVNVAQMGVLQASYYHRVSEKYELGAELQVMAAQDRREAICTLGGRVNFLQAILRGQIDTTGRVAAVLEEKLAPAFSILLTADLDHLKGESRFGMGIQLEH